MTVFGAVLPAALLLIFACVTGNAGNMFQGTLVVSTLLTRFPKWQITLALGDCLPSSVAWILWRGLSRSCCSSVLPPPVAGIYIADFFMYRRNGYRDSVLTQEPQIKALTFVAWISGAVVGFMTVKGVFTLTTIPSVDSIVVACIVRAAQSSGSTPIVPAYNWHTFTAESNLGSAASADQETLCLFLTKLSA
jgi:purine-cytosine permease-like protein